MKDSSFIPNSLLEGRATSLASAHRAERPSSNIARVNSIEGLSHVAFWGGIGGTVHGRPPLEVGDRRFVAVIRLIPE